MGRPVKRIQANADTLREPHRRARRAAFQRAEAA